MENNIDNLYTKLVCALTHNIEVCDECKQCGEDGAHSRMNLIRELAGFMKKDLPWVE